MAHWRIPADVQHGAIDWRAYAESAHADLAGTVNAAHLLAVHTLHAELMSDDAVVENPVFEHLSLFPDLRRALLARRERVLSLAGF
jgi:hypothetical protein